MLLLGLAAAGCGVFHRTPPLPPIVVLQPPILFPAPAPAPMPPPTSYAVMDAAPDFTFAMALGPAPRSAPRRVPEASVEAPPQVTADTAPPPSLTPALTPQQQANFRNQVEVVLQRARNDVATLAQRRLSGSAAATRAQAGEYVRQAEQALQEGDLMRAQTLAAKAETLARFLLGQ